MATKIYVVTHKTVSGIPADRTLIGVGSGEIDNVGLRDSGGESISEKNANFCELTALYWIWKNDRSDLIGLEHYRRFFCKKTSFVAKPLSVSAVEKKLKRADILLPRKLIMRETVYEQYNNGHIISDLDQCRNIIGEKYPDYLPSFDKTMKRKRAYMYNMFVMRRELLCEYAEWLFSILFEAEKRIDLTGRDPYQMRVFGFLSERLFQVWITHHNLKVKCAPVYNIGEKVFVLNCKYLAKSILLK